MFRQNPHILRCNYCTACHTTLHRVSVFVVILWVLSSFCSFCTRSYSPEIKGHKSVAIIAHRAPPTFAPENTLLAMQKAKEIGVHMIEIDLHQTKDKRIVVLPGETVHKTTDGRGRVRDMTLEQIRRLDAGSWFSGDFTGTLIATLEEVFEIMDDTTELLLEIKKGSPYYPDIEQHLIDLIYEYNFQDRVPVKSFGDGVLRYFREHAPEIPIGKSFAYRIPLFRIIIERGIKFGSVCNYDVDFLHSHRLATTHRFVRKAREKGFQVYVWDVHSERGMKKKSISTWESMP